MYSIVVAFAMSGAPMDAGYLLPGRAARVEARAERRSTGCSGGQAASQGCSGGQAIQFTPAASCSGGQGAGASFAFPHTATPTTFYYVPAAAPPQSQAAPLYFRRCPPGQICW